MRNKLNILKSFRDKRFKYGGYATILVAMAIALLVVVNLLVDLIPLKADLTKEKIYSLSDQTYAVLDNLKQDVSLYVLAKIGKEDPTTAEILRKYAGRTERISLTYVDPLRSPGFAKQYEEEGGRTPGENSIIVASGKKFKALGPYDLVNYRQVDPNNPDRQAQSLKIEQVVTGAIMAVTSAKDPEIHFLQGHREESLPYAIREQLEKENYLLKDLSLLTEKEVPAGASILMIISPKQDITAEEEMKIRDFLFQRRGRAIFMMDLTEKEFPNIGRLLKSYGVAIDPVMVVERDAGHHVPGFKLGLVPELSSHSIAGSLKSKNIFVLFPLSQAISELEAKRRNIEIEAVITSTEKSYGKADLSSDETEQVPGDPDGPFNLVVAITDNGEGEQKDTKAVVFASSLFLYPERIRLAMQPGNLDLLLNSLSWLQDKEELISIRPKSLLVMSLRLNQVQFYLFAGISVILIPLLILGSGLVIWLRRRHL